MITETHPASRPGFARALPAVRGPFGRPLAGLLFDPETGGGTSGGNPAPADDRQNLQGLLARHNNDAMQVVATLLAENHSLRDERRTLRSQLPPTGAVVLTAEQAQAWAAYQQLGTVEALTQERTAAQGVTGELASLKRQAVLRSVQDASGANADVLAQLPGAEKLTFDVRESQADGKTVKTVFVKDEAGAETELRAFVGAKFKAFEPAIFPAAQSTPAPTGTNFVPQNPGTGGAPADPLAAAAKAFQAQRDAAPSPFAPKAPTQA
jgi:hypothetical protein